jgi:hypothetical protein
VHNSFLMSISTSHWECTTSLKAWGGVLLKTPNSVIASLRSQ